jgi:hypothetical protein
VNKWEQPEISQYLAVQHDDRSMKLGGTKMHLKLLEAVVIPRILTQNNKPTNLVNGKESNGCSKVTISPLWIGLWKSRNNN